MRIASRIFLVLGLLFAGSTLSGCICMFTNTCFDDNLPDGPTPEPVGDPASCPYLYEPVCGQDGVSYDNACIASELGVGIIAYGTCGSSDACPEIYDPVCGEDRVTYFSPCEALQAGATLAYPGECVPEAPSCPPVYDPVCGEDGQTYMSSCDASLAGVGVANEGECVRAEPGCASDDDCADDERCAITPAPSDDEDRDAGSGDDAGAPRGMCQPEPADDPCGSVECERGTHCAARRVRFGLPCPSDAPDGEACSGQAWIGLCIADET